MGWGWIGGGGEVVRVEVEVGGFSEDRGVGEGGGAMPVW